MTDAELAAIEARANAASAGPWVPKHTKTVYLSTGTTEHEVRSRELGSTVAILLDDEEGTHTQAEKDLEFIAATRSDVPDLVAEVRRLRAELTTCGEAFNGCASGGFACGCGHAARAVRAVLR